jgi:hypothetical protein
VFIGDRRAPLQLHLTSTLIEEEVLEEAEVDFSFLLDRCWEEDFFIFHYYGESIMDH